MCINMFSPKNKKGLIYRIQVYTVHVCLSKIVVLHSNQKIQIKNQHRGNPVIFSSKVKLYAVNRSVIRVTFESK